MALLVSEMTPEQKERKRVSRIAKFGGDDRYSWALFVYGSVKYNGMDRNEATWRRDRYIKEGVL